MKKIILPFFLALFCSGSAAQFIDHKIDLYVGTSFVSFLGGGTLNEGNFIYPSLFSNFPGRKGVSVKGMYKIGPVISVGAGADLVNFSGWKFQQSGDYDDSGIRLFSVCPVFQVHNKFHETGLFNRVVFNIEITPVIGMSELQLEHPVFDIRNNTGNVPGPMNSKDIYYGLGGSTGMTLAITKYIGFYINYSILYNRISSSLYIDRHFTGSKTGLGIVFRLKNNKRYYY